MNRLERDRFIASIGLTDNDIQIWGQYERLVDFIFEEYPVSKRRFDEISLPTLFVISHTLELALKENIKFFQEYNQSKHLKHFDNNWTLLLKSHDLDRLADEFKIAFNKLHKNLKAGEDDKKNFNLYYIELEKLIKILNRNSETFRYSLKIDNEGKKTKESIKFDKKIDLLEVKELFEKAKILFIGAPNSLGKFVDFIDFKKGNPNYTKGKGYLFCQKLFYSPDFLERTKERLSEQLTPIENDIWLDSSSGERFEIQVWNKSIYIIAI